MSDFAYPLHEECGVFGIYDRAGTEDVAAAAYSALYALQHRGQESCGIAVNDDGVIEGHRDLGLVNEVFTPAVLTSLAKPTAHMATGHVRYATSGSRVRANAQPMIVRHGRGTMALCHNGNLTNALELRRQLENEGAIFHGSSDTEVICYLVTRNRLRMGSIETAISKTMDVLEGAYSLVIMSATKLIAVRDPRGYRPLCIGTLPGGGYVFASESCALDAAGATLLRDVEPGEIVVADAKTGELRSIRDHVGRPDSQMCVFEYIYFSRPDSIIEGQSVHEARKQAGRFLAQEHPVEADVVIGVPDSGLDAALGYSEESGIPYGIGFIKNKYIGRTFIQGSQKQRENSVRIKLNAVTSTASWLIVVIAVVVAALAGVIYSLLLAFASINLKADQTIGGTALNLLATAVAVVIAKNFSDSGSAKLNYSNKPFLFSIGKLELSIFVPLGIILLIISYIVLYKTRFGLRLRACGEHPQAADSVGINVYKMRYAGVMISGALGAIGGLAYIVPPVQTWNFEVGVAGAGFLAMAVMIFGQWKPFNICGAAMFFAVFKSLANIADSTFLAQFHWSSNIYNMMPFIASMIILAFTSKNSMAPKAEGIPYDKGSR